MLDLLKRYLPSSEASLSHRKNGNTPSNYSTEETKTVATK
jgi:hypothetical protein